MDAIEVALRKCLHVLVASNTITERKRNIEAFVELLKDNRTHDYLDRQDNDENFSQSSISWNEMFSIVREFTINELSSIRVKSAKTASVDLKYQESLKLFKAIIEHANARGPQLDGRPLIEAILSILTSDAWSSCFIVLKELSHLLMHHVLSMHKYLNELREQEWIDLSVLYMSLAQHRQESPRQGDPALYSSYLKMLIEKSVIYNDLDAVRPTMRKDFFDFLRMEIDQLKQLNHFAVIENYLHCLNCWSFKYLLDMPDEVLQLATDLLPALVEIWRRKCSDKAKTEILKFCRLQMSIHHPYHRTNPLATADDTWMKSLRDLNDLLLREIVEICHKQRSNNRLNSHEFLIRSDLLHLASRVFYQLSSAECSIKSEAVDRDDLFEPSAKRTRYENAMSISNSTDPQMRSFHNLFQSIDPYHQAAGFQIVALQLQDGLLLSSTDGDSYISAIKRYLAEERRPSLLANALQCLHLLLTSSLKFQFTVDVLALIQPLIHIPICEPYVIDILGNKHPSLALLCSCSSPTSLKYLFRSLTLNLNHRFSVDDENRVIQKFLPDLMALYRHDEHDLSIFLSSQTPEYSHLCASILMQFSSLDPLPQRLHDMSKKIKTNEFDRIESEWCRLKFFTSIEKCEENETSHIEFQSKLNRCELNISIFKRIVEIYGKNVRFIQQLKDKHWGERSPLILHYAFLGIHMLHIVQLYFTEARHDDGQVIQFVEAVQILFTELTEETHLLYAKHQEIPFTHDLLDHLRNAISICPSSSLLQPILPSLHTTPSVLYGFLEAKFLSYLYNFATQEVTLRKSTDSEGVQCPIDPTIEGRSNVNDAFEIILLLTFQAVYDQPHSSRSFLSKYCFNYSSNINLLVRLLEEKVYPYLEELPLPDPISYGYLDRFFSYVLSNRFQYYFNIRQNDFEFLSNLFSQSFRTYRRDIRLCERSVFFLERFIELLYGTIREQLLSNTHWIHLKKIIDAFWQMAVTRNSSVNAQIRRSMLRIKQLMMQEETITIDDMQPLLDDPSYWVRSEAHLLCRHVFYEHASTESSRMDDSSSKNDDNDEESRASLGIYLGRREISKASPSNHERRLKSSNEQEKIYRQLMEKNSTSILFLRCLADVSEYVSCQVTFRLVELGMEGKVSTSVMHNILPKVRMESILQSWHRHSSYSIAQFPWEYFPRLSRESFDAYVCSTYAFSSPSDRQQLERLFPDLKASVMDYFPQLQAYLLPLTATKTKESRQVDENSQWVEKRLGKTEYNRLMKQRLTMITLHLLLTYWNNQENEFHDPWKPEPIQPAYSWAVLLNTFDYMKQVHNTKTFADLLIKSADIGEILLCLSSHLFASHSIHEQLRLLNVFSLFLTDVLLTASKNDYLHSILRDSTYILLRYMENIAPQPCLELYEQELKDQILNLLCNLLHQLCSKGFHFDDTIYQRYIPDIVLALIHHDQHLTRDRIQTILMDIYQLIRPKKELPFVLISYIIEQLGYLTDKVKIKPRVITSSHYLSFLATHCSSLPAQWLLEMFHRQLDIERETSSPLPSNIDGPTISTVKQQLLDCIRDKRHPQLAGPCLAKLALFSMETTDNDETLHEEQYEPIPSWVIDDLLMRYLIDREQTIVECARSTLKILFSHSIGQELYHQCFQENFIEIYSVPYLSSANLTFVKVPVWNFSSSSNPWLIAADAQFDHWFVSLVNNLFKQVHSYYKEKTEKGHPYALVFLQLNPLAQLKLELAIKVFPHLIHSLLLLPANFNLRRSLSKDFNFLLEQLLGSERNVCQQMAKVIFRTMNYLHQCPLEQLNRRNSKQPSRNFDNHTWLDIDYLQLAKCASQHRCYQSAIIYTDIWTTKQRSSLPDNNYLTHLYYSDMDLLCPSSSELIDLFVRVHSNLNQSDEFYGLDKYFQNRSNLYGEFHQLNSHYYDALFYYDQAARTIDASKLIQSLRLCGFNHILENYLNQVSSLSNEIFYRIQLTSILTGHQRLTQWKTSDAQSCTSVREDMVSTIQRSGRLSSSSMLQTEDHQLWSNVADLRECLLINVLDDMIVHQQQPEILSKLWIAPFPQRAQENVFDQNDELLLTRIAITHAFFLHRKDNETKQRAVQQTLLADLVSQICQNALDSNKLQLCDRYLSDLSPLIDRSSSHELSFLRAKLLVRRQQDIAGEYLRQLIESPLPDSTQIRCRLLLCDWLNETRCETSSTIKQQLDFISNAVQKLDASSSSSLIFESYLAMARFSDHEYQRLHQLFHSPMFENKRLLITRNQAEYAKQEKLDPMGRYTRVLKRSLDMDQKEIDEQKKLQYTYLISTLNNYLTCLKLFSHLTQDQRHSSDAIKTSSVPEIMITSKCLSYWFANANNEQVNKSLKKNLLHIPTHFFLPFVYQMAARMAWPSDKSSIGFHSILLEYLSRCIVDHPHHVLPVIFALVNAHKDAHINQQQQQSSSASTSKKPSSVGVVQLNSEMPTDTRSRAAQYLLERCIKIKPHLVDQMRKLNDAYIEAAYWDIAPAKLDQQGKDLNGKNPTFPKQLRLMQIKDFHEVAIPTIHIPIASDGCYQHIETIKNFHSEYTMVGGVNAPKKIACHSSTGRQLPQLLKGKDDLRQDAVMQQLFTVVNRLLEKDDLTAHRSLHIRTYKVVPLTQKSGVLEWCEGTITLGDYLSKLPDGAHARYHPEDWTAMDCRRHIHKATNAGKGERERAFVEACSKLKPVFRYFFYEHYTKPTLWHRRKQAYAKSVATSSIVGYIVGLGDRHVQNILIDTQTAEFIHIDLGVAFDQGKMLPIPETIPFRLTRDVIDGLGICGTEGLFKKSCEITLELMRQYADTLITIIEVFLYDPLYQWQLSPQKALQLQQQFDKNNNDSIAPASHRSSSKGSALPSTPSSSSSANVGGESVVTDTNKMAERLLLGLRQKLQGVERLNQMTIKAHVNMLIQEATSMENLSQLFAGWQPYL